MTRFTRANAAFAFVAVFLAPPVHGQQGVPDHYAATRTYVQGTVLDVSVDGMTLVIEQQNDNELFTMADPLVRDPANRMASDPADPIKTGLAIVFMKRTNGWVFIDDPEGGPQQRVRLDDFRLRFEPGHVIQIGAVSGLSSSASEGFAQMQSSRNRAFVPPTFESGLRMTIEGWVYVRINTWRLAQEEQ